MKKIDKKTIIIIVLLLILISIVVFMFLKKDKSYMIMFDTDGGTKISNIEVKNDEIIKLPEAPKKEGHKFVGWTNNDGKIITKGTKVTGDLTLKAKWISDEVDTVSISYDIDGETNDIVIEKGSTVLLPVDLIKEGYIFIGWVDEDGYFISEDLILTDNIILKPMWIKEDVDTVTIEFDTDGGNSINSITIEKGKEILLPINPVKDGYIFAGWVDSNGNAITKETIVNENIVIKATWKKPYVCPTNCTPIGDGSKCTKVVTKSMTTKTSCPSGYKLKDGKCLNMSSKYHAKSIDKAPWWKCNSSSDYMYSEIDESGLGAMMWCVKKKSKITTKVCPSGYTKDGDKCVTTKTVNCSLNQ